MWMSTVPTLFKDQQPTRTSGLDYFGILEYTHTQTSGIGLHRSIKNNIDLTVRVGPKGSSDLLVLSLHDFSSREIGVTCVLSKWLHESRYNGLFRSMENQNQGDTCHALTGTMGM
jgi:hypothetical protein